MRGRMIVAHSNASLLKVFKKSPQNYEGTSALKCSSKLTFVEIREKSFKTHLVDAVSKLYHCKSHLYQQQLFVRVKAYNNEETIHVYESFFISFR